MEVNLDKSKLNFIAKLRNYRLLKDVRSDILASDGVFGYALLVATHLNRHRKSGHILVQESRHALGSRLEEYAC